MELNFSCIYTDSGQTNLILNHFKSILNSSLHQLWYFSYPVNWFEGEGGDSKFREFYRWNCCIVIMYFVFTTKILNKNRNIKFSFWPNPCRDVISSDLPCKACNVRFTTVPTAHETSVWSKMGRYSRFYVFYV